MMHSFTIKGTLPGLNDYLRAERCRQNKHNCGNDMKQKYQFIIKNAINKQLRQLHIRNPVIIHYEFFEPNRRRDLDNIAAVGHKFIQDALVAAGVLADDGWKNIIGFTDCFAVDRLDPRIIVSLEEVAEKNEK